MTNPNGQYFISYRRSPCRPIGDQEGIRIRDALRDRGIPTWRDLDNLGPEPTEEQLRETLAKSELAGAVMLISKHVKKSPMIKIVELQQILKRFEANDGFVVHLVAIGLEYEEVAQVLDQPTRLQDLSKFNMTKVANDELTDEGAICVANKISRNRLRQINTIKNNTSTPLKIGLYSRSSWDARDQNICFDFSRYFDGRRTTLYHYQKIETALEDVAKHIAAIFTEPIIFGRGLASLPLCVMFGAVFSKFCFDLTWIQILRGTQPESWSLSSRKSDIAISVRQSFADLSSKDIVLALSVSADIESAVADYIIQAKINPRATLSISLNEGSPKSGEALSASDGITIAKRSVDEVRKLKDVLGLKEMNVHVFISAPSGIAVFLGHQLNTISDCYLYEHMPNSDPVYERVLCIQPSNYNYN